MRNEISETISEKIIKSVNDLPYFSIKNLKIIENIDEKYLRINLSRLSEDLDFVNIKKKNVKGEIKSLLPLFPLLLLLIALYLLSPTIIDMLTRIT